MRKVRFIVLILITLFANSCKEEEEKTKLAQVHDEILYLEELNEIIPNDATIEDSITIINNKIDLWVRKQAILNRAELNLNEHQKDIESIVEDYKASLLIEKYKQEYIKQELDTIITEDQIESYYNNYPESFKLSEEIVKVRYYKLSDKEKNTKEFRKFFYSDEENAPKKIQEYIDADYMTFKDFQNNWVEISAVSNLLPNSINNAETLLKQSKKIQTRDADYHYFVSFKEYKLIGETIPLELASDRIRIILLNKRKTNIINELEERIYQNAVKNGNIKIFID